MNTAGWFTLGFLIYIGAMIIVSWFFALATGSRTPKQPPRYRGLYLVTRSHCRQ